MGTTRNGKITYGTGSDKKDFLWNRNQAKILHTDGTGVEHMHSVRLLTQHMSSKKKRLQRIYTEHENEKVGCTVN